LSTYSVVTHAGTHLTAIQLPSKTIGTTHFQPADIATINAAILNDLNVAHPQVPMSFSPSGRLIIPNRGALICQPGDLVWVDSSGGCGVITGYSLSNGSWTAT